MKAGNIIFVRGDSIISKVIRRVDKGEFSHVAVALSDSHIIEAEWSTKSIITPFVHQDYEIVDLNLTKEQEDRLIRKAVDLTGFSYDYPQLLGYIFKEVSLGSPKKYICSEIAYELLKEVDIDVGDRNITPNQLYKLLTGVTLIETA